MYTSTFVEFYIILLSVVFVFLLSLKCHYKIHNVIIFLGTVSPLHLYAILHTNVFNIGEENINLSVFFIL